MDKKQAITKMMMLLNPRVGLERGEPIRRDLPMGVVAWVGGGEDNRVYCIMYRKECCFLSIARISAAAAYKLRTCRRIQSYESASPKNWANKSGYISDGSFEGEASFEGGHL